jgi:pyruvate/2-oxoglutarate dehydrogenase complex dihydrolipoamide dehydrogenase (E3) component
MIKRETYDCIIIGAGVGGVTLALGLAQHGRRTALIECSDIGGNEVIAGAAPTKALLASAHVAHLGRHAREFGVNKPFVAVDLEAVRGRKDAIVEQLCASLHERVSTQAGLEPIIGRARFTGPRDVEVKDADGQLHALTAPQIFIAAGARARWPDVDGLDGIDALCPASILDVEQVPRHLLVLGGGYTGIELAQLFRRFGADVTVVEQAASILSLEGLSLQCGARAVRVRQVADDEITLTVVTDNDERTITGSHLLVAAGRRPNSDQLDLQQAGVRTRADGTIEANDRLETSAAGVYALGDITGGESYAHAARDDARIILANLVDGRSAGVSERVTACTICTDPEFARAGLTQRQAEQAHQTCEIAKVPTRRCPRAVEMGETEGLAKVVVADGKLVGAAVIGPHGGEIASIFQVAIRTGASCELLRDMAFAHPTMAELVSAVSACAAPAPGCECW